MIKSHFSIRFIILTEVYNYSMKGENQSFCSLCGREKRLTFHHLIPRICHSNKWFKKKFTTAEMKMRGIYLCRDCHHFIHKLYSEKELGRFHNTTESLLESMEIQKFLKWVRKKK